jgi:hypothetical protein
MLWECLHQYFGSSRHMASLPTLHRLNTLHINAQTFSSVGRERRRWLATSSSIQSVHGLPHCTLLVHQPCMLTLVRG